MENPNFIGTEDAMITDDGVFPLPEAWKEFVGFDATEYWKQQDREKRRQAQLEKCELDDEAYCVKCGLTLHQMYGEWVDWEGLLCIMDDGTPHQLGDRPEFADDEIPDDRRFTLPGYDPDDFTDDR